MVIVQRRLSNTLKRFFDSEGSGGILLIICTAVSLLLANSAAGVKYLSMWQRYVGGLSVEHWVNDALMAVFFLLIGLELERELYSGNFQISEMHCCQYVRRLGDQLHLLCFIFRSMQEQRRKRESGFRWLPTSRLPLVFWR